MTVLGLLVASFITQGQPFLPTFSTLAKVGLENIQQRFISDGCLPTSIAQTSYSPNLCAFSTKYQKILSIVPNKISRQGCDNSNRELHRKVTFSPILKTASVNTKPLNFSDRNFGFTFRKEWDAPQTPFYNPEQRLLAQYYRGQPLPVLRYGSTGDAVRVLQTLLTYNRYGVAVSGRFDVLTETAVKAFQANRRLVADGIVGSRTWRELTRRNAFHSQKDSMEIPPLGDRPLYPWQKSFRGNFAESSVSI